MSNTLPAHLFISDVCGDLHDTRVPNWSTVPPLRANFRRSYEAIETVDQFKATLRNGGFTFPGCYPLYFVCSDGEALSFEAARENFREIVAAISSRSNCGWRVVGCSVNYEDSDLFCAHSGKPISSAYGDDEESSQ